MPDTDAKPVTRIEVYCAHGVKQGLGDDPDFIEEFRCHVCHSQWRCDSPEPRVLLYVAEVK